MEREARGLIARVEGRVAELERVRIALLELVAACQDRRATEECPILDALEDSEEQQ